MYKIFYTLNLIFMLRMALQAQERKATISGTVTSNGNPVLFASVYIKGEHRVPMQTPMGNTLLPLTLGQ